MNRSVGYPIGCSVLIPSSRLGPDLLESLQSICKSVAQLTIPHEVLLSIDRIEIAQDPFSFLAKTYSFVRVLRHPKKHGGPGARYQALLQARFRTLLFTDDDVWVPLDWAPRLYQCIQERGIVTGLVQGRGTSVIDRCEELIDQYRLEAKNSLGYTKFISFPNFGIQRELLPEQPFDPNVEYNLGSLDLGNQLHLNGHNIFTEKNLVVRTNYPATFKAAFARKIRHARGIAYVHARLGDRAWHKLEMGSHRQILWRWIKISLTAPFSWPDRVFFLFLNLSYVLPLIFFYSLETKKHD